MVQSLQGLGCDGQGCFFFGKLLLLIELLGVFGDKLGLVGKVHVFIVCRSCGGFGEVVGESFVSIKGGLGWLGWELCHWGQIE